MSAARCIAVDWGTTSLRAVLLGAGGHVLERAAGARGILTVIDGRFSEALDDICGAWQIAQPTIPVVMSGMIGSQHGWVEAPYLDAPCSLEDLIAAMIIVPHTNGKVHVVPGVRGRSGDGAPEIMRGEEIQVGGIVVSKGVTEGLFCIPGTHSKWVRVAGGRIKSFATFMTGECFDVLKDHSILGRLMDADYAHDAEAFEKGVARAEAPGGLLHHLFAARTLGIVEEMPKPGLASYLSGQLIGAEITGARSLFGTAETVHLVAGGIVGETYRLGLEVAGVKATIWDAEAATLAGLWAAAESNEEMKTGHYADVC